MLNRLTKSAEVQMQVDDEYFKINLEGHQMRLKLENTLKNCHQVNGHPRSSDLHQHLIQGSCSGAWC